jgi:hypothetical protein
MAMGSSARTSSVLPGTERSSARRANNAGSGHFNPRRSTTSHSVASVCLDDTVLSPNPRASYGDESPMTLLEGISREATYITGIGRSLLRMRHVKPDSPITIVDIVSGFAGKAPQSTAILYQDRSVTYRELEEGANRYAHWGAGIGHPSRRCRGAADGEPSGISRRVAGLLKLGAVVALINTNLRGLPARPFDRCRRGAPSDPRRELAENYLEARAQIEKPAHCLGDRRRVGLAKISMQALAAASARRRSRLARRRHLQGQGVLHFHLRHHGAAQGRQHQPYAHAVHDVRLCGRAERQTE